MRPKYKKIKSVMHEGAIAIFVKKRFLFFFWVYVKCPRTKVPISFNHDYNVDAFIEGEISFREMSNIEWYGEARKIRKYSKVDFLLNLHKKTGLSRNVCEELYEKAKSNELGQKYFHCAMDFAPEKFGKEPGIERFSLMRESVNKADALGFLIDLMKESEYTKQIIKKIVL